MGGGGGGGAIPYFGGVKVGNQQPACELRATA